MIRIAPELSDSPPSRSIKCPSLLDLFPQLIPTKENLGFGRGTHLKGCSASWPMAPRSLPGVTFTVIVVGLFILMQGRSLFRPATDRVISWPRPDASKLDSAHFSILGATDVSLQGPTDALIQVPADFSIKYPTDASTLDLTDPKDLSAQDPNANSNTTSPKVDLVVASLLGENTSWLQQFFPEWQKKIYIVDNPNATLTVPKNKGHESIVYLTYIIDHYDDLPPYILFLHAKRFQWHYDNPEHDGYAILRNLKLSVVREEGYVNLRCIWQPGCSTKIRPFNQSDRREISVAYRRVFEEIFPGTPVPTKVGAGCCAQFAVTSTTIRRRPKEDYVWFREWLLSTGWDDTVSGGVFEYSWHMIFGKAPVSCPIAPDCYCRLYGLCDLRCTRGHCDGYDAPIDSSLPAGWPLVGWNHEARPFHGPL